MCYQTHSRNMVKFVYMCVSVHLWLLSQIFFVFISKCTIRTFGRFHLFIILLFVFFICNMCVLCSVYCVSNSSVHQKIDIEPLLNIYNSWYNELLELFVVALLSHPSHFFFLFFVPFFIEFLFLLNTFAATWLLYFRACLCDFFWIHLT